MSEWTFLPCAKCGSADFRKRWDAVFDKLRMECNVCGYSWEAFPLDALPAPPTEVKP